MKTPAKTSTTDHTPEHGTTWAGTSIITCVECSEQKGPGYYVLWDDTDHADAPTH